MHHPAETQGASKRPRASLGHAACAALLCSIAAAAHAGSIYECIDAHGGVAFRDTPCVAHARETKLAVAGQPLIDPSAPKRERSPAMARHAHARGGSLRARRSSGRDSREKEPVSYECRAADGEVFYRHSRCPGSVRGDGVARFGVDQSRTGSRHGRASRGNPWGAIPVTARKITRSEACRQINATAASARDGHARDEQVSVYEHNLGRDPCRGY